MINAAERLRAELGDPAPKKANARRENGSADVDLFERANGVDTRRILEHYGLTYDADGDRCDCPGCGLDDAKICKNGGTKCLHDRCAHAGPPGKKGFRTNIDVVAERERLEPLEAAKTICGWFGIPIPEREKTNGSHQEPPPADDYDPSDDDAPDAPPGGDRGGDNHNVHAVAPKARAKIEIIDAAAIWAELKEPRYIVDSIIRVGSLTQIVAYGASGKSWMSTDMTVAVGAGVPWLERFVTVQGRALYLDYEAGSYEMRRRFQAVTGARAIEAPIAGVDLACMPALYMSHPSFESQIATLADGRSLITVDTLKAANPGVDENASDMRVGLDILHRVGERTECAFVVLTHAKKTTGNPFTIDAREAGRGSSAIFDAADTVLHVHYEKDKPLHVQQTKSRLGRHVAPFLVRIEDVEAGVRVWAEDVPEQPPNAEASRQFDDLCNRVVEVVRENPGGSGRIIRARAGAKHSDVLAALEHLERHGAVRNAGSASKAKWFPTRTEASE